jgi:2-oxoacid:acceptor oxidoreductase delta subunit (pyruvate/2-ketoisovalerate family)
LIEVHKKMKKRYSVKSLKELPVTAISFLTTEGNETGEWRSQRPTLDLEKCNRCGLCWMYCPDNAIVPDKDSFQISYKYCKGCGICASECPREAILIVKEKR